MSVKRPKTSIDTTRRTTTLPNLSRTKRCSTTQADVQALKLKIQKMRTEKLQTRSKTNRMKQILHDRNAAIDHVFKESSEKQKIKTASGSTLEQLKVNIAGLQNTLASRQQDLKNIIFGDKIALSDELQQEVKVYYLEHKRLKSQEKAVKDGEKIVSGELERVRGELDESPLNIKALESIRKDLKSVIDKSVAYKKGQIKLQNEALARYLKEHPKHAETKEKELNKEIELIREDIENINKETKQAEEDESAMIASLQHIIDEQTTKIREQIERIKQKEIEEEEEESNEEGKKEEEANETEKSQFEGDSQEHQIEESSIVDKNVSASSNEKETDNKEDDEKPISSSVKDVIVKQDDEKESEAEEKPSLSISNTVKDSLNGDQSEKKEENLEDKPEEAPKEELKLSNIILGNAQNAFLTDSEKAKNE